MMDLSALFLYIEPGRGSEVTAAWRQMFLSVDGSDGIAASIQASERAGERGIASRQGFALRQWLHEQATARHKRIRWIAALVWTWHTTRFFPQRRLIPASSSATPLQSRRCRHSPPFSENQSFVYLFSAPVKHTKSNSLRRQRYAHTGL